MDTQQPTNTAAQANNSGMQSASAAPAEPPMRLLSQDEKNDLRKRVLSGGTLSLDEARAVLDSIRTQQGGVMLSTEAKPKKGNKRREVMSDQALDTSLDAALDL